ncbi:unnamed protein product, partial [marine sediment metagenome]
MRTELLLCLRAFSLTSVFMIVGGCTGPKAETIGGRPVDPLKAIR